MIILPLEALCQKDLLLVQLLSDRDGLKLFEFDPDINVKTPYATWQIIHAAGDENLSGVSEMDEVLLQIDIYGKNKAENRQIAKLIRKAIEQDCQVENFTGNIREPDTDLFRISLDTRWFEES